MNIVIDFSSLINFFSLPADLILWRLFLLFGWIPIAITFLWGAKEVWLDYIRAKWLRANIKHVLLAIDIPRGCEQSPRAVENMFSYLAGAHGTLNLIDIYWEGKFQLSFSYEIVSIEGYTQFLVRTPVQFRDLVESSVYSQYPDAEITEVNDYTEGMPTKFPNDEYDIWGAEFIQAKNSAYPIKLYEDFEHQFGPSEMQYKDPMAALMDLCSSLRKGEQLWYQIILIPIGWDWPEIGDNEISKVLGEVDNSKNIIDKTIDSIIKGIGNISEFIYEIWGDIDEKDNEKDDTFKMFNLKPKEKRQIEAINDKVSKLGLEFKIRMVYIAKKEVMNKGKVVNGFVGYMKQFAHMDLNNLKPDMDITATSTSYFLKDYRLNRRKNNIINNYIARDDWAGRKPGILNTEELATIWHFPVESVVKAPLIQKAPGRKAEPPMGLPVGEEIVTEEIFGPSFVEEDDQNTKEDTIKKNNNNFKNFLEEEEKKENFKISNKKKVPPSNLPIV